MKKRFSVEQIVAVLKQAELGMPVADLIRRIGISEQTFYRWKKHYAGLETDQVRKFKQLAEENVRLKKLVADLSVDEAVLQDVLSKNSPARAHEGGCGHHGEPPRHQPASGLFPNRSPPFDPAQAEHPRSAARHPTADARDRPYPDPLRLPPGAHHAAARWLGSGVAT